MSNQFDDPYRRDYSMSPYASTATTTKVTVINPSGIRPKGHAVLGLPYEKPKKDSLIVIPETVKERTQMLEDKIRIVAIGGACWYDEPTPRAAVGDLVLIPYLSGRMVRGKDGVLYRMVNDKDIIAECDEFDTEV